MSDIATSLRDVQSRIDLACTRAERTGPGPALVAVSKTHGADRVRAALAAGHRRFGENRVQEAQGKWPALKADFPDVRLHLIGGLQTNKAVDAVTLFDVIETLDRPKLARALKKAMDKTGRTPTLLVQVNTGEEAQKGGVLPADLPGFLDVCRDIGVDVAGLMCIPPAADQPAPHFAFLVGLAATHGLTEVSMGMSGDFETAAALGATEVRVGTGIFGARQPWPPQN